MADALAFAAASLARAYQSGRIALNAWDVSSQARNLLLGILEAGSPDYVVAAFEMHVWPIIPTKTRQALARRARTSTADENVGRDLWLYVQAAAAKAEAEALQVIADRLFEA